MNNFKRNMKAKMNLAKSIVNNPQQFVQAIAYGNYDVLPFSMREMLKRIGNQEIVSLQVVRAPISNAIMTAMNVASGFQLKQKIANSDYDTLFHLSLKIFTRKGSQWDLEKEDVVKINKSVNRPNQETMNVNLTQQGLTINQLIQNTINTIGMRKFTWYDGKRHNCQVFLMDILQSNGLLTPELTTFVKQDTSELVFNNRNPYFRQIMNTVTDVGNRVNSVLSEGMGMKKQSAWINHVKSYQQQHGCSYKEAMLKSRESYHRGKK